MLFDRIKLSNEDFEGAPVDTTEAIIEGDLAYADAMDIAREAMMDATAMDAAQNAVNALNAKIANEEYLLANPEKITTETVVLAQESYRSVAAILGANVEDIEGVVSHESIENSPITALQVSHEGVKDFIVKLYESIKLLFKKIANAIKKVVVKLVVAMNGVEKAAKKLQDKLKKNNTSTPKEKNLKEKDAKVWNKYFQAIAKLSDKDNVHDAAKELLNFYTTILDSNLNNAANAIIKIGESFEKTGEHVTDSKALNDELDSINKKISHDVIKYSWRASVLEVLDMDEDENIIIINPVNDKVKGIIIKIEKNDDDNKKKIDLKFKVGNITIKSDGITSDDVPATNPNELLTTLISAAKGLKGFSDRRIKEIDAMYKELDKLADQKGTNVVNKFLLKQKASFGTNIRALVAGAYLDSVLGYSSATKKVLAYCRDQADMFSANEL